MAGSDVPPLVTCQWLQTKIESSDVDKLVVLDVSWSSQKDCQAEFHKEHIEGARYMNVLVGPHTDLYPRNLPAKELFEEAARAAGVNNDSHVVLYSDSDNFGFFLSGRAWWTFLVYGAKKVSILNGGLQRWRTLGYKTTSQSSTIPRGNFKVQFQEQYRRTYEDMLPLLKEKAAVLDSRAPEKYNEGHLPDAISLPYTKLVDSKTGEMSPDHVKKVLGEAGVDVRRPVTTYCTSGMSSCTLAFACMLIGGKDFAVFHGGYNEWKTKNKTD